MNLLIPSCAQTLDPLERNHAAAMLLRESSESPTPMGASASPEDKQPPKATPARATSLLPNDLDEPLSHVVIHARAETEFYAARREHEREHEEWLNHNPHAEIHAEVLLAARTGDDARAPWVTPRLPMCHSAPNGTSPGAEPSRAALTALSQATSTATSTTRAS